MIWLLVPYYLVGICLLAAVKIKNEPCSKLNGTCYVLFWPVVVTTLLFVKLID